MVRTISTSRTYIIRDPCGCANSRPRPMPRRVIRPQRDATAPALGVRPVAATDLPWVQAWAAQLGLPAPRSRRVRSFVLLKDHERIGSLSAREGMIDTGGGREPIMWIAAAFLTPANRGKGLILKFGEILSRDYYRNGKVGARIATNNAKMHKIMTAGRWKKVRTTRRFVDYMLELQQPYRASRGR